MKIEIKILNFFLLRKNNGSEYSNLINLDRYLVHSEKERKYLGIHLSEKIQEMLNKNLITKNNNQEYAITSRGLQYLEKNK
ncbi:hypothetical protein [Empedobacter brevis]|uniref:hypothetical protein n=1 Tax=Empedobacter brevis TaxID=247 RepID=UPI002FE10053